MQQNTHEQRSLGAILDQAITHRELCGCSTVRGLLSWMQVVTSGKVTLGQVMAKGRGGDTHDETDLL